MLKRLILICGLMAAIQAHANDRSHKDAAAAVQEGSVVQWLDYYRRERGMPSVPPTSPAGTPQQGGGQKAPAPKPSDK